MMMSIRQNFPTWLTLSRICMTPLIVAFYYSELSYANWLAVITLLLAGLTDIVDGYLARSWQVTSKFGRFLDPIADKLLIITALLLMLANTPGVLYLVVTIIIISREIVIIALRQWLAESNQANQADVSIWGKMKTIIQVTALSFLLLNEQWGAFNSLEIGTVLLVLAAVLAYFSLFLYVKKLKNIQF